MLTDDQELYVYSRRARRESGGASPAGRLSIGRSASTTPPRTHESPPVLNSLKANIMSDAPVINSHSCRDNEKQVSPSSTPH